jgi:tetratricopeptide (TPR) repeat protein
MVLRKMALDTPNALEKERYRSDAKGILRKQINDTREPHPFTGLAQILLDEIREKLEALSPENREGTEDRLQERVITDIIGQAEDIIYRGLQKYPEDEYLFLLQADLSELINNKPKAIRALETAFQATPRSDVVAIRLALHHLASGNLPGAEHVLKKCLEYNPDSKRVHLQMAMIYINEGEQKHKDVISYHLKRSFTEGDSNHSAQMKYARHEFIYGKISESERIFRSLGSQRFSPQFRNKCWGEVKSHDGKYIQYKGQVVNKHDSYCFINIPEIGTSIFAHYGEFGPTEWEVLMEHTFVSCNIAFTVRGPCGIKVKVTG